VPCVHNVQAALESKGFSRPAMKIVEICNAKYVEALPPKSNSPIDYLEGGPSIT